MTNASMMRVTSRRQRRVGAMGTCLALAAALTGPATRAWACGGLFCDRPNVPTDLPVAQTGENVLFAMDPLASGGYRLEAHIQIFYTGPADRFSWVVPVDALPTLDTGSNALFAALDAATRPQILVNRRTDGVCSDDAPPGLAIGGSAKSAPTASANAGGADEDGGVRVAFHGNVGPYDALVVRADDPGRLRTWLADNGYFLSPQGGQLLDAYVAEQKFFVALKLQSGKGIEEIQPIVLRFEGPGPCVPLRLTAVASAPDLRVNLWVLGAHRVVPENYFEIVLNEAKLDWLNNGRNYQDLLKSAANEAGGNAFTVEYAGSPTVLKSRLPRSFAAFNVDLLARSLSLQQFQSQLATMGLAQDPAVVRILASQNNKSFDAAALAATIDKEVIQPLVKAVALFDSHAKLTRLVTFISPEEMNSDPTFVENNTLPDVSNVRTADAVLECGARAYPRCKAPTRVVLADGRSIWFKAPAGNGWCGSPGGTAQERGALDLMPSLQQGWKRETSGEGVVRFDNRATIADALDAQETAVRGGCGCTLGGHGPAPGGALTFLAGTALLAFSRRRWRR